MRVLCCLGVSLVLTAVGPIASVVADDTIIVGGRTYQRKEFRVSTGTTGPEKRPGVAFASDGTFMVTWDTGGGVRARGFAADGTALTDDVLVHGGMYPDVAAMPDASFLVVSHGGYPTGLHGRRIGLDGTYRTGSFFVNTSSGTAPLYPRVGTDAAGESLVVWEKNDVLGQGREILGRRLDAAGTGIGPEFIVNTMTEGGQDFPKIDMNADGRAIVIWRANLNDQDSVRVQRYEPDGLPEGGETVVSGSGGLNASVAIDPAGNAVAAWEMDGHAYAQRLDSGGALVGDRIQVTDRSYGGSIVPNVDLWDDGTFAITWYEYTSLESDCYARLYDADGQPLDELFVANCHTEGRQYSPKVACGPNGTMAFVWRNGSEEAYVTLLVPEPATLFLSIGAAASLLRKRRRCR